MEYYFLCGEMVCVSELQSLGAALRGAVLQPWFCVVIYFGFFCGFSPPAPVYNGLKSAGSRLAFRWVSSCYFSSRLYF